MGATSSSHFARSPTLTSISEREAESAPTDRRTDSRSTSDHGRQRTCATTTGGHDAAENEPRSQLTYATQMTGWQAADGHGPPTYQQNNEVMELSRVISQLAMANHQLACAHNATLARMEALYLELSKEREHRKRAIFAGNSATCDDVLSRRLRDEPEEAVVERDDARRLEQRVVKLESLLATGWPRQCDKQRESREDDRLRSRIDRLESWTRTRDSTKDDNDDDEDERSRRKKSRCERDASGEPLNADEDQGATTDETDEARGCCDVCSGNGETSVPRIDGGRPRSANVDWDKPRRRRARSRGDEEQDSMRSSAAEEEVLRLSEEIERLRVERSECQGANERLLGSLADQKNLVAKLSGDYEELKARYASVEANLHEHRQQHGELTKRLDSAKSEIDDLRSQKGAADARISVLERDLQQSLLEMERMKNAESQEATRLRAQLTEEMMDKKKQMEALEEALREIERLKETVKTERRNVENDEAAQEEEVVDMMDSMDDAAESLSGTHRAASLEEFKKELTLKREARQRAIAAVSSEMERLRRELDAEKEAHTKTSGMLALLRSARGDSPSLEAASDEKAKSAMKKRGERERSDDESEKASRRAKARRLTNTLKVSDELRNDIRYQIEKVDDLRYHLESDPERHRHRIRCLTEASSRTRESLRARERQTNELKDQLAQLLVRLGDRSFLDVTDDAGAECDRQLENINTLKALYNERLRVLSELRDVAVKELTDSKQKLEYSLKKSENFEEELKKTEEKVDAQASEITNLESQLGLTKADCRDLQNQMSLINGLFTQMLLGASSADMDLDRLTQLLQENHELISDIAREESTEAAALPKLLLDLVEQVEGGKASQKHSAGENSAESNSETFDRKEDDLQEEDIAHNLPKVWRVLLELLSCHAVTSPSVSVASCSDPNSCYKSVDTPAGPTLVISVSKTYIRLKELILEKKHLEKEMNRMKQLNAHLESKLGEQEKRLSMVSAELTKTWNIVGRMQAQHQQLHTHEEILRYELQQKRKMLQELKQELEYCREKWESARQKNTNTELEWRNLRREFAARKALAAHDSFNNSAESGFSDERGDDTDEEEEAVEGRIRHGPRRRTRKESPRAPTPDTESEQPTDTELSESKTGSSVTLEQRTPTPETEAELDEIEVTDVDSEAANAAEPIAGSTQEILNPLDQALTNVIENLIIIDDEESSKNDSQEDSTVSETSRSDLALENGYNQSDDAVADRATASKTNVRDKNPPAWTPSVESWSSLAAPKALTSTSNDLSSAEPSSIGSSARRRDDDDDDVDDGEITKSENTSPSPSVCHIPTTTTVNTSDAMPVFSIGPFPASTVSSIKSVQFSNPLIVGPSNRLFAPVFGAATAELDNSTANFTAAAVSIDRSDCSSQSEGDSTEGKEQRACKLTENVTDSDSVSVDSSSSLDTVREFPTTDRASASSSSTLPVKEEPVKEDPSSSRLEAAAISTKARMPEEVLAARADRLKRLEEQADWLVKKMNATSRRGSALCTRLEELHDVYGEPPIPPPMPDVLPSRRLPSSLPDLPRQVAESSSAGGTQATEDKNKESAGDETSSPSANAP
ncbi:myosin-2 heavy chain isoform X2 [Harpegnathos saltator]|uniref:myosin-2 heavy chain isoform X2 n=1 Tax=Harpegnathos saltator TaxID=610380 RepID=UPI00058B2B3C|nr:myosin-2 heavy chain isoform X2 [Harpegnathos saltator]